MEAVVAALASNGAYGIQKEKIIFPGIVTDIKKIPTLTYLSKTRPLQVEEFGL